MRLTLTATLVAGALGEPRSAAAVVCTDVDGDGALTRKDCQRLLESVVGLPIATSACDGQGLVKCGDLDVDGTVTTGDAAICLAKLAGNRTADPLCNLTPPGKVIDCPGGSVTIARDVTSSQTWPKTCTIFLDGTVFVAADVTVTVEAGTTIKGKRSSANGTPSALVFRRGSKLVADGTASEPIVFTSDQAPGARGKGDWGGLVLNGRAPTNVPGGEGLAEGLASVPFGGNDPNDSSGVLRYVRVEYAGRQLTVDNELNILTLNGVGAGTVIDHVQAHVGLDDCIEWFGGTVNAKYLVATACGDDGFDWQLGTRGATQYGLVFQNLGIVESGGHGFEGDNNENGFDFAPRSSPRFCNVTAIGTRGQAGTPAGNNQVGALLRRGTGGVIAKTIIQGFAKSGIELGNATPGCSSATALTGDLVVREGIVFDVPANATSVGGSNAPTPCDGPGFFAALQAGFNLKVVDPGVTQMWPAEPADPSQRIPPPDFRPSNAAAVTNAFDCRTVDPSFETTGYTGAFDPAGTSWLTLPWINFNVR